MTDRVREGEETQTASGDLGQEAKEGGEVKPHRNILPLLAASALGMATIGSSAARPGRGCVQSVESIRRSVSKRRAAKAAKAARRRNRR